MSSAVKGSRLWTTVRRRVHGCVYIWVVVDVGGVGCVFGTFTEQLHPTSNTVSFNGAWTDRRTDGPGGSVLLQQRQQPSAPLGDTWVCDRPSSWTPSVNKSLTSGGGG